MLKFYFFLLILINSTISQKLQRPTSVPGNFPQKIPPSLRIPDNISKSPQINSNPRANFQRRISKSSQISTLTPLELEKFTQWKNKFGKIYKNPLEEEKAAKKFLQNIKEIDAHNELFKAGKETFSRGVWMGSDLTYEEKQKLLMGEIPTNETEKVKRQARSRILNQFPKGPPEVNWVKVGRVNGVRDQGQCGSCWAFTAVGVIEGVNLKNGINTRLSEQQLVDCSKGFNAGCNGGDVFVALKYVKLNGIGALQDYPYTRRNGKCQNIPKVTNTLGTLVKERLNGNEERLKDILAAVGPVGIAINAAPSFSNYQSGVYNNPRCTRRIDHAMLLVGYGTDSRTGLDYWLIKNSWGTSWGEGGYAKMVRNRKNQCGIANEVAYILP